MLVYAKSGKTMKKDRFTKEKTLSVLVLDQGADGRITSTSRLGKEGHLLLEMGARWVKLWDTFYSLLFIIYLLFILSHIIYLILSIYLNLFIY